MYVNKVFKAASITLETHTLARYICESTLQDYQFIGVRPSHIAAAAMYLTLRMKKLGDWVYECWHSNTNFTAFPFH